MITNIQNSIKKLKNRKNITLLAVNKLISLVTELESYLSDDLTTVDTKIKIKMEIDTFKENYRNKEYSRYEKEGIYSLKVVEGKIVISDIAELGDEYYNHCFDKEKHLAITALNIKIDSQEERDEVIKFDFMTFILAIEELMIDAITAGNKIDEESLKFIDFCNNWESKAA